MNGKRAQRHGLRRLAPALAVTAGILLAGACAQSGPPMALPTLEKDPRKILTKEEQKQAIKDVAKQKDAETAEAVKQIEKR